MSPKFLGDQGTKKLVSHSSGLEDFAVGLVDFTHNLPEKASVWWPRTATESSAHFFFFFFIISRLNVKQNENNI